MRVTIDGSGHILTHGDSLSGGGVIEFPVNEPPEFAATLTNYTVTGSSPSRKLKDRGHEIAVETPTSTAERAPSTAGGGVTVTGTQGGSVASATEISMPGVVSEVSPGVAGVGLILQIITFPFAFDTPNLDDADGVLVSAMAAGSYVLFGGIQTTADWSAGFIDRNLYIGPSDGIFAVQLYANRFVNAEGTTEGPAIRWTTIITSGAPVSGFYYPTGGELRFRLEPELGLTTGAGKLHVVIATPAA